MINFNYVIEKQKYALYEGNGSLYANHLQSKMVNLSQNLTTFNDGWQNETTHICVKKEYNPEPRKLCWQFNKCRGYYFLVKTKKSPLGYQSCRLGCRRKPPWSTVWAPPTWRPTRPATIERHNNEQCYQMNKTPSFNQGNPVQCSYQRARSFMNSLCLVNVLGDTPAPFSCRVLFYGLLTHPIFYGADLFPKSANYGPRLHVGIENIFFLLHWLGISIK